MKPFTLLLFFTVLFSVGCQSNEPQSINQSDKENITDHTPFTDVPPDTAPAVGEVKVLSRSTLNNQSTLNQNNLQTSSSLGPNITIGEIGKLSVSQSGANQWHSFSFTKTYQNPVVVMQPLSHNGGDPAVIRLRKVTGTGFEFQIDEWDYLNGAHGTETVSYIAMETGVWINGLAYEVGKVQTDHNFTNVNLNIVPPGSTVLTQAQTYNGSAAITTRQETTAGGFRVKVQEEQRADGNHTTEDIGYIAILPGEGPFGKFRVISRTTNTVVSHNWHTINYNYNTPTFGTNYFVGNMQTNLGLDPATVRYQNLDHNSVQVRIEEEQSADSETNHGNESVGYLLLKQAGFDEIKLLANDGDSFDGLGFAVAISRDTIVVGAPRDSDNGINSGAAYIYERNAKGNWRLVKKISANDGAPQEVFGRSVAISGDTVVVGAYLDDDNGSNSGSAYIYERNHLGTNNWGQFKKLTAHDGASGDRFGISVAISGNTIVVGAFGNNDNGPFSGSTYVYERNLRNPNNWGQIKKIIANDGASYDQFGRSVAISGDTIVVGAFGDDDNGLTSGSAYIYERNLRNPNNWGQLKKITASDGDDFEEFGRSVAISGNTVVVGAYLDDDNGSNSGSAYIYERNHLGTNNWGQFKKLTAHDGAAGNLFGRSVSISGNTMVVGADFDDKNGSSSGSAYVYEYNQGGTGNWGQIQKIVANDGAALDFFGASVAISKTTVVVGATGDDDNGPGSGSAYIYE